MKYILTSLLVILCILQTTQSQTNLAGNYNTSGYFFHPVSSRSLAALKTLSQISTNVYQADLGDLGGQGYVFQFTVDINNNLINWVPVSATPALPASNFMTLDNPGNITYTATPLPGSYPYQQSIYNNTYNPVTHTFYMHYGYGVGSSGQTGFSRQVYEKWVLATPPIITSVTPLSITSGTQVTIRGKYFTSADAGHGIFLGGASYDFFADSAVIVSDSLITAWAASGAAGQVAVQSNDGTAIYPTLLTYTPLPPVINTQWQYLGAAGFSSGVSLNPVLALDHNDMPFVAFVDSVTQKTFLMKYPGPSWINVGSAISDGISKNPKLVIDNTNNPIVAYTDSTTGGSITIKKFNGSSWVNQGLPSAKGFCSLAIDGLNTLYLMVMDSNKINVWHNNGGSWHVDVNVGQVNYWFGELTISKNTNIPYIFFPDRNNNYNATVMKYTGSTWVNVGNPGFTNAINGIYYPMIVIDTSGNPIVSFQEDDGFDRASVYKYSGGTWNALGSKFTKSRAYSVSLALKMNGDPFLAFTDYAYNGKGTVRALTNATGRWDTVGQRGFLPITQYNSMEAKSFLFDSNNTGMIVFPDNSAGRKISVMKLINSGCYSNVNTWTGVVSTAWENSANWSCGVVPGVTTNVIIGAGATVELNSNATIYSLYISPGASFTIDPGHTLTILAH